MLEANEGLENIFENAVKEAEKRKHEYVTIEHVLLSLVKDKQIGAILIDFKTATSALIKDIEDYLDTKCADIVSKLETPVTPRKTASLERLMNRAFTQALFQGRQDVNPIDILISVFAEKKSYAAFFLKKHQFNKHLQNSCNFICIKFLVVNKLFLYVKKNIDKDIDVFHSPAQLCARDEKGN